MSDLLIGDVAAQSGCSRETIRHYEKLGLLARPKRQANGYRCYPPDAVKRLRFIRHGRQLGLELATIQELLALSDHPEDDCTQINRIAEDHLHRVETQIARLQRLADELRSVVHQCQGGQVAECRIVESLYHEA